MERAGLYGDLLFETLFVENKNIRHAQLHYERLTQGLATLKMPKPYLSFIEFVCSIEEALPQNNPQPHRVRFVAKRNGNGNYLPIEPQLIYEVSVQPLPQNPNDVNKPYKVGLYTQQQKAPGPLSNLKSGNALLYVMASIYAQEQSWQDALITNTHGFIIETTKSNIFWLNQGQWFTPPLAHGPVAGIGRSVFMETYHAKEKPCTLADLQNAEQLLLTNALYLRQSMFLAI